MHFHHIHFILQAVNRRVHTRKKKHTPTTLNIYLFSFNEYFLITTPKKIFTVWIRYVYGIQGTKTMHKKTILLNEWVENKSLKRWETERKKKPNKWIEYKMRLYAFERKRVKCLRVFTQIVWVCQEKLDNCVFWMDKHLTNK